MLIKSKLFYICRFNLIFAILTDNFYNFLEELKEKGYEVIKEKIEAGLLTYVKMEGEENRIKMEKLIDAFREDDDVLDVWTNCEEF